MDRRSFLKSILTALPAAVVGLKLPEEAKVEAVEVAPMFEAVDDSLNTGLLCAGTESLWTAAHVDGRRYVIPVYGSARPQTGE